MRHLFSYILDSKHGVTDSEVNDLLSCDDVIMQGIHRHSGTPEVPYVSSYVWQDIKYRLQPLLLQLKHNGYVLTRWRHRSVAALIRLKYHTGHEGVVSKLLSQYFEGNRVKSGKHDSSHETGVNTLIKSQPLRYGQTTLNWRKVSEYPYHLTRTDKHLEVMKDYVFNLHTLLEMIRGSGVYMVMELVDTLIRHGKNTSALGIIQ